MVSTVVWDVFGIAGIEFGMSVWDLDFCVVVVSIGRVTIESTMLMLV